MPLSQILIDGEGWKKVEGKSDKPKVDELRLRAFAKGLEFQATGLGVLVSRPFGGTSPAIPSVSIEKPSREFARCLMASRDRGTVFVGGSKKDDPDARYLWAIQLRSEGEGKLSWTVAPYCSLRVKRGDKGIEVTELATDKDGRIYAATSLGIQVFDPTGRLCGVMTSPKGKSELMAFDGDKLTLWIGDTKYTRKLNTTGPK
jgi:hypothetical protein